MSNSNLITSFLEASLGEKITLISIILLVSASTIVGIPLAILFKEPKIFCKDPLSNNFFECPETLACDYDYFIDKVNGPQSFSAQYELICENSLLKIWALTGIFIGYLIGAAFQTAIIIDAKKRKAIIVLSGFSLLLCLLLMFIVDFFSMSFTWIIFACVLSGISYIYINSYCFIFASETFKGDLMVFYIIVFNVGWGVAGIIDGVLGYYFNASWKILVLFGAILCFISTVALWSSKIIEIPDEKNTKEDDGYEFEIEERINILSLLKDLWPNVIIRNNFIVYVWNWSLYCLVYFVQEVELESVGGSVYFNIIFCCVLEIFAAFISGILMKKYSSLSVLKVLIGVQSIVLLFFLMAPMSTGESTSSKIIFFVSCLLITKLSNDLINMMTFLSLSKMISDKYVGLFSIISRGFARILLICLPTINYILRNLGIHPFVFYGFLTLLSGLLMNYCKEVQSEGMDNLMNDVNMGIINRAAIASASHSLAGSIVHQELLKKINVEGVPLSVIHNYKKNPDSIKNLSTPLLRSFNNSKSLKKSNNNVVELIKINN